MARQLDHPKKLILDEAKTILYRDGYKKLSMRAIAKASGIALGTIYNYYPTKQNLVVEMMRDFWQAYLEDVQRIAGTNQATTLKLQRIFEALGPFIKQFRLSWLTPDLYEVPDYVSGGVQEEERFVAELVVIVEKLLQDEQEAGRWRVALGTRETARFIIVNFVAMVQMPQFSYADFRPFLNQLVV